MRLAKTLQSNCTICARTRESATIYDFLKNDLGCLHPIKGTQANSDYSSTYDMTDPNAGVLVVDSARSKAVIGFGAGKTFDLGDLVLKPGPTMQDGFSAITASVVSGETFRSSGAAILVTATGYVENTGMGWNADKSSVGDQWGTGPVLCEGISLQMILKAKHVKAWALDPCGQRTSAVVPEQTADGMSLQLGPQYNRSCRARDSGGAGGDRNVRSTTTGKRGTPRNSACRDR